MFIYTTFVSSFENYLDPKLTETAVTKANILKTVKIPAHRKYQCKT